ncbi:hypothetical protein LTR56_004144 [Elasticomyces elasticus]|nr:hypothetical protein LTR22_015349 [Elasticomyces elasticus]KAK3654090.1 hypothetical protein LTR56_004144 [Elasticomyces elasticus]KAK4914668.1 hypothetical protein LTR49_017110 [Elasticomyces elasticus]KAK5753019.1 hypothetical protein LTS12_016895 [Elasticomyces elasticus]
MDDDALQAELEAMASNAGINETESGAENTEPMFTTIARWKHLFKLSPDTAVEKIIEHRNNLTRIRVSSEHWETVRDEQEVLGHDRESYEYELELAMKKRAMLPTLVPVADMSARETVTYLVELDGPLSSAEIVRETAGMEAVPPIVAGESVEEGRAVQLCCIDGTAKAAILRWASEEGGGYEPVILVDPRSMR